MDKIEIEVNTFHNIVYGSVIKCTKENLEDLMKNCFINKEKTFSIDVAYDGPSLQEYTLYLRNINEKMEAFFIRPYISDEKAKEKAKILKETIDEYNATRC